MIITLIIIIADLQEYVQELEQYVNEMKTKLQETEANRNKEAQDYKKELKETKKALELQLNNCNEKLSIIIWVRNKLTILLRRTSHKERNIDGSVSTNTVRDCSNRGSPFQFEER